MQGKYLTLTVSELLERGLGNVAHEMNKIIASFSKDMLRRFSESCVEKLEMVSASGNNTKKNMLYSSSSPRFNIYGCDFGWGRPVAVRTI